MTIANQLEKNCIAFIESNTTGTGRLFIKEAKCQGLQPIFITKTPEKYSFLANDLLHPVILDTNNFDKIHDYLSTLTHLQGILSSSDCYVEIACRLAEKLGLPSNDPEVVKICRNKDLLARILREKGINSPKTLTVDSSINLTTVFNKNELQFPIIIKPSQGTGSMGVRLCNTKQEAIHYINLQFSASTTNKNFQATNTLLLQEYIQGDEYSVETFADKKTITIIGITKKYLSAPPFFIETGHDFPASLSTVSTCRIHKLVIDTLKKIGFIFGPAHVEIRIKDGVPYIIEINPRLAGGMIPQLIKQATNHDLIAMTLSLVTGKTASYNPPTKQHAAIRFIIPPHSGVLNSIQFNQTQKVSTVAFHAYKSKYETINLQGDYRDRIGYVMATEVTLHACQQLVNAALNSISLDIIPYHQTSSTKNSGRLKSILMPEAQRLIHHDNNFDDRLNELRRLCKIDEVHIIMLFVNKIISKEQTQLLLKQIITLQENNFDPLINRPAPRGLYLLYENYFIENLGMQIGGVIHTARSRNDINATVFKLKFRENYWRVYKKLWYLRSILLNQSKQHIHTVLPIYSQYQTALPSTLSHYLLAMASAFNRDQQALQSIYPDIDTCPLGAGAGGGTTFNIDQTLTAQLLGFSQHTINSLDAVASRDLAVRLQAILCTATMTLSRFVVDLQLWSTQEFGFIEFPDYLSGGSSMMPQKKNPYLLEKIQGLLSSLLGCFTASITTMYKVPFCNSVEVGTESLKFLDSAFDDFTRAISLLILHLSHLSVNPIKIKVSLLNNLTFSTYITEMLVKSGHYNFRAAHQLVSEHISYAINTNNNPIGALLNIATLPQPIKLDPLKIAHEMDFGGGPGINSMHNQYQQLLQGLHEDAVWFESKTNQIEMANALRKKYILDVIYLGEK